MTNFCTCEGFQHAVKIGAIKETVHQVLNMKTQVLSRLHYYSIGPKDIRKALIFQYCPACGKEVRVNHEFLNNPLLNSAPAEADASGKGQ